MDTSSLMVIDSIASATKLTPIKELSQLERCSIQEVDESVCRIQAGHSEILIVTLSSQDEDQLGYLEYLITEPEKTSRVASKPGSK